MLAGAASVVALALCGVSAAGASTSDLRLGVHAAWATGSEMDRMQQGGVEVMRPSFLWAEIQPTQGSAYRWSTYDALVKQATLHNITLLPILIGPPKWASGAQSYPPTSDAALRGWKQYVRAVVDRYGPGGDFWRQPQNLTLPYRPITAWQAWNEPNMVDFWAQDPDPVEYAKFLKLTSNAVHQSDSQAKVVLAGMGKADSTLGSYMNRFYRVRRVKRAFDIAAVHPYGVKPAAVKDGIENTRRILDKHGDERTPLWITETGWAAGGPPRPLTVSYSEQAERLRETFRWLERKASDLRLGTVIWFSWRDVRPPYNKGGYFWQYCGLFRGDGSPKPSWDSFVRFTGGNAGKGPITEQGSEPTPGPLLP